MGKTLHNIGHAYAAAADRGNPFVLAVSLFFRVAVRAAQIWGMMWGWTAIVMFLTAPLTAVVWFVYEFKQSGMQLHWFVDVYSFYIKLGALVAVGCFVFGAYSLGDELGD